MDETRINPNSNRQMDYTIMTEFASMKTMLAVVIEDVKEIKADNKEVKTEVYGKDGYNGIKGRLNSHIKLSESHWKTTLWALGVMAAGISVLWAAQVANSSGSLNAFMESLSWLQMK